MTSFSRLTLTAALLGALALPATAQGGATAGTPAAAAGARANGQVVASPARLGFGPAFVPSGTVIAGVRQSALDRARRRTVHASATGFAMDGP